MLKARTKSAQAIRQLRSVKANVHKTKGFGMVSHADKIKGVRQFHNLARQCGQSLTPRKRISLVECVAIAKKITVKRQITVHMQIAEIEIFICL